MANIVQTCTPMTVPLEGEKGGDGEDFEFLLTPGNTRTHPYLRGIGWRNGCSFRLAPMSPGVQFPLRAVWFPNPCLYCMLC